MRMQTYDAFLRMTKSIGVYSKILITIFIIIRLCIKYRIRIHTNCTYFLNSLTNCYNCITVLLMASINPNFGTFSPIAISRCFVFCAIYAVDGYVGDRLLNKTAIHFAILALFFALLFIIAITLAYWKTLSKLYLPKYRPNYRSDLINHCCDLCIERNLRSNIYVQRSGLLESLTFYTNPHFVTLIYAYTQTYIKFTHFNAIFLSNSHFLVKLMWLVWLWLSQ